MLKKLINGHEKPDIVLVEDSVKDTCCDLIKALITGIANRVHVIHVCLYEVAPARFTSGLPLSVLNKLKIQDMTADPFGWISGHATLDAMPQLPSCAANQKVAIIIDSLNGLVRRNSCSRVCRVLHGLAGRTLDTLASDSGTCDQIFAVIHKDVEDMTALRALEHTAGCILNLFPPSIPGFSSECHAVVKRSSGKWTFSRECFSIDESFCVETLDVSKQDEIQVVSRPAPDPTANMTFNLTLKKEEEEARRRVVLPYLAARDKVESSSEVGSGHGLVTYNPSEEDFEEEEEDPDDDLDI